MTTFLKNILQLMLSPASGWHDIAQDGANPRRLATRCMVPLFAVAALTTFVQLRYAPHLTAAGAVVTAASIFVSLFATYAMGMTLFASMLPQFVDIKPDGDSYHTVLVYGLSMLALSETLCNLLPFDMGLPYLLPLAVGLIVWKSGEYLGVSRDKDLAFIAFALITIILPPALIQQLFSWAMNN